MNLENFSISELRELQDQVKKQLKIKEQKDMNDARAQILEIAQRAGVSLKDLIGNGAPAKVKQTVAVKYRHPTEPTLQWSGRGRQPKWVKEWLESGKKIEEAGI